MTDIVKIDTNRLARARALVAKWMQPPPTRKVYAEQIAEFTEREVKAAVEWTPVSERLPERKEGFDHTCQCLVWYQGNEFNRSKCGIAYYHYNSPYKGEGWIDFENLGRIPIAWMPLPEPYQPKEEQDRG